MATPPEPRPAAKPEPTTPGPGAAATPPTPGSPSTPTPESATTPTPATRAGAIPPTPDSPDSPTPDSAATAASATGTGATPPTPESPATPTPPTPAAAPPIYPLSLRLEGRRVLVVGGGSVALRRVAGLQHLWCARADDAAASAAWVPAVGRAGAVTVAVNAGRNPRRAAELRDRFVDTIAEAARSAAKEQEPAAGGQWAPGRVSIVGGGPGDPGLITVTGLRRLREADVVVADRLAPLALLE